MSQSSTKNIKLINHPVVARDLTIIRDKNTSTAGFREAVKRVSVILAYHALQDLPLQAINIETPVQATQGHSIDQNVVVVPILRAGLSLVDAIMQFMPEVTVGHLGMYRDEETFQPVDYYSNIPGNVKNSLVLVVDPMLATGGSADDAITHLKKEGAQHLRFISLISAPEGIDLLQKKHSDVPIITSAIDKKLNDDAFIVPGLGDAGDRYFGTE